MKQPLTLPIDPSEPLGIGFEDRLGDGLKIFPCDNLWKPESFCLVAGDRIISTHKTKDEAEAKRQSMTPEIQSQLPQTNDPALASCGGSDVRPCVSCGARATLSNYDGDYCKDCMQLHILEKMFVNLTALQGKRHE